MNKAEIIDALVKETGLKKKDCEAVFTATIGTIQKSLVKGEKVQIVGFGSFEVRKRNARKGRNPRTKQEITIPAAKHPVFSAGKNLKAAVNVKAAATKAAKK